MIVEEIMKTNVQTLKKTDTIEDALRLMNEKKIRHLPITNDLQELIGLVTDRDLRDATPSIFETEKFKDSLPIPLEKVMKKEVITGHALDLIAEASAILYEHRIGCLPILKGKKLVGILTATDLLHTFIEMTGINQPGSQIEIKVQNKTGMLYEVASVIRSRKANIQSVLVHPYKQDDHYKIIELRVQTMNPLAIIDDLKAAGHEVLWPNHPGKDLV